MSREFSIAQFVSRQPVRSVASGAFEHVSYLSNITAKETIDLRVSTVVSNSPRQSYSLVIFYNAKDASPPPNRKIAR